MESEEWKRVEKGHIREEKGHIREENHRKENLRKGKSWKGKF